MSTAVLQPEASTRAARAPGSSHRILRNSTLNLAALGLQSLFNLLMFVALARSLSKDLLGEYFTLFAFIMVVQVVLEAGLTTLLTYRIAQDPEHWQEPAAEATGLCLLISLASLGFFAALGAVWGWARGDSTIFVSCLLAGVTCAFLQVQRFCAGVLRAFERFGSENIAKVLQSGLYVALIALLTVRGVSEQGLVVRNLPDINGVLAMLALSYVVADLLLFVLMQRLYPLPGIRLSLGVARRWLGRAVPVAIGDIVRSPFWQLDAVLLGVLQPPAMMAVYSVASRPLAPLNWLPLAFLTAAFPSFVRMAAGSPEALNRAFAASLRLMWVVSLPLAVGICMAAEPLVRILAGPGYHDAVLPMCLIIWKLPLLFLSMQFRFLFTAVGKQQSYARLVVTVFLVEGSLQLILIPWLGYYGACLGSLFAELFFVSLGLVICRHLGLGGITGRPMLGAALAAAAMAGVLWLAQGAPLAVLPIAAVAALGLYLGVCLLLGALSWREVRHFLDALLSFVRPAVRTEAG
jgi:O-antigen/teichoic acid export membrane protein